MIVAIVRLSSWIRTFSFASTAWCRPSDQRRPARTRPVNSSMMRTLPLADHVVDVALVERVRAQALVQDVERLEVDRVVEVGDRRGGNRPRHRLR